MEPVSVEFLSESEWVRGRFFSAIETISTPTLLLFPGWPGSPEHINDVLNLGDLLSNSGINVCMFIPRGLGYSEGIYTHANIIQDIKNAWQWIRQAEVRKRFKVDTERLSLGGHCGGGGMAMAYAAQDPSVRRVISIAGNDHGEFSRELMRNPAFAKDFHDWLMSTHSPQGLARFDLNLEKSDQELYDRQDLYGLRENAVHLADRSILLFGGWEDSQVTVDQFLLPFYRTLKAAGADKVTFIVYHTDHNFSNVRHQLAADIADWLRRESGD